MLKKGMACQSELLEKGIGKGVFMTRKIAVIDGNSLMHRAYHAVPPTMNAPDGTPTNAVFGFLSMLLKFIDEAAPDVIVCAFDAGKPSFRIEALEQYKAQRPSMDDELRVQFPVIEDLLEAMRIPVVKVDGWEGDDILGTVAARDEAKGYETLLVTGDKDACQLASDLTKIVTTKKGITDVAIMGPAEVLEKYGVTPSQFPDYLGLMGDSSDNIPGVPGVGAKTATKYLQSYGSIEGLYENLADLKGKTLEKVRDNKDLAFLSRQIATIRTDLDFELDVESLSFPDFDTDEVTAAFGRYRMTSHLSRILNYADAGDARAALAAQIEWKPIASEDAAAFLLDEALQAGACIGVAFEKAAQASLFGSDLVLGIACEKGTAVFEGEEAQEAFARIAREGRFTCEDVKAALRCIFPCDEGEDALLTVDEVMSVRAFDLGVAAYVLDSSVSSFELGALLERAGLGCLPECAEEADRAAMKASACLLLHARLTEELAAGCEAKIFDDIEMPLLPVLSVMERTGACVDGRGLQELSAWTQGRIGSLRQEIIALAGEEFNVDSPQQLSHILFEVLELPHGKKTQRGYSTDASVLRELAKIHQLPALVIEYRENAKMKSTYLDALPALRALGDRRVHTTFNQTVTATGRLSSSAPNLQNIPVRTAFGRKVRECFVPLEEGQVFLSADYSQIELRLLAHLSEDEHLIAAFAEGEDFHAQTASRVFAVPIEKVTPELRSRAKAVNFGIVYGQQAFGLSQSLDIPFGEARDMIDRYFEAYPQVRAYLDKTVEEARANGFAQTLFGRKRYIHELKAKNAAQRAFGERTAMNHPMQGTAADIIKIAMVNVQRRLLREGLQTRLLLQVHDELDFSVPQTEIEQVRALVKEEMESVVSLRVPLVVDVSWGANWAEAH